MGVGGFPFNALTKVDLADFVRRHLGEEAVLGSVSPELGINYVLAQDRAEWYWEKGETLWAFQATIAANAGNVGHIEVFNPAASGFIVVVTDAEVQDGLGANTWGLHYDGAAGGAPVQNDVRDTRVNGLKAVSQNLILNTTVGVSGIQIARRTAPANNSVVFKQGLPFVLTPGHRLQIWSFTVNLGFTGGMAGYEYRAKPEELV
jgi:hypothetical protein